MSFSPRVFVFAAAVLAAGVLALAALGSDGAAGAPEGQWIDLTGPDSGYLEVPDHPELDPGAITVEAWVYLKSYGGHGSQTDCPIIVGKDTFQGYSMGLACGNDGVLDSYINGVNQYNEQEHIPLNEWTHVALTYDGTTRRHFINGQSVLAAAEGLGPLAANDAPLRIGSDLTWDFSPDAMIDNVRLWDVARTREQIAGDMNRQITSPEAGLVASWVFDSGPVDSAGGHDGTFEGDLTVRAATPTPSPTPSPSPSPSPGVPGRPGDADCDGRLTATDATLILEGIAGVADGYPACGDAQPQGPGCPPTDTPTPTPTDPTPIESDTPTPLQCTDTPTPSPPPPTDTPTPTPTPTERPTGTPTDSPTTPATATATATPSASPTSVASSSETASPSQTVALTMTPPSTSSPTATPTATPTETVSETPAETESPSPTATPEPLPARLDADCDSAVTGRDAVLVLLEAAGMDAAPDECASPTPTESPAETETATATP